MAEKDSRQDYLVTEKLVKRFDEAVAVDEVNLSIKQLSLIHISEPTRPY